jgi:hypothetical protein
MKKIIIAFVFYFLFFGTSKAQSNWEAGVRFGERYSLDFTIPLAAAPRLHPAVYLDRFGVGGYFDWMFALSEGPTGLKFYPGLGPEFFFEHHFDFNIAGNFGAEYSFDFPLTIGLDWRPHFAVSDKFRFNSNNWGVMVRFRFGEGVHFVRAE